MFIKFMCQLNNIYGYAEWKFLTQNEKNQIHDKIKYGN